MSKATVLFGGFHGAHTKQRDGRHTVEYVSQHLIVETDDESIGVDTETYGREWDLPWLK